MPIRQRAVPWQEDAAHALRLAEHRRGHQIHAASRLLLGVTALGILAFLVVQAQALLHDMRSVADGRPETTLMFRAAGTIRPGDVVAVRADGSAVAGLRTAASTIAADLPATAGRTLPSVNGETGTFRAVAANDSATIVVTASGGRRTRVPGVPTHASASLSVAADASDGTFIAALLWQANTGGAALTLAFSSDDATTWRTVNITTTGTQSTAIAAPAFVRRLGRSHIVVGRPCGSTCCIHVVDAASLQVGAPLQMPLPSTLTALECPTEPVVFNGELLVLPGPGTVDVVGFNLAALTASRRQSERVEGLPVLAVIPAAVTRLAGVVAVTGAAGALHATFFRYDATSLTLGASSVTHVRPRQAAPADWSITAVGAAYRSATLDVFVTATDSLGTTFAALVDASVAGIASELVAVSSLAGLAPRRLSYAGASGAVLGATLPITAASGIPTLSTIVRLEWHGGLTLVGVAKQAATAGTNVPVVVAGHSFTHGGLVPGQQYALGPHGTLQLAALLPFPVLVVGEALAESELDVTMRQHRV